MPHVNYTDPVTGKVWPSVTAICGIINKPGLSQWRGGIGNKKADKILKDAQDVGLEFHEIIQQYLENSFVGHEVYSEKALNMANAVWSEFVEKRDVKPVSLERHVISDKWKFSGTLDGIIKVEDKIYLVDWKTSSRIDKTVALQLCGYLLALDEMTAPAEFPIDNGLIVQVDKKSCKVKTHEFTNLRQYNDIFLSALKLWYFTQE